MPKDGSFDESHYFKRLHHLPSSSIGSSVAKIMNDYNRKTIRMLPPNIRDATIAIRYDEAVPCYSRAIVSGPLDTPYFGGIFVFDMYLPQDYPDVPPQVRFL